MYRAGAGVTPRRSLQLRDRDSASLLRGGDDGIADERRPIAVLEGPANRRHVVRAGDRTEEVRDLVDEEILPADHVSLRPPVLPVGMRRLADEHRREARRVLRLLLGDMHLEFIHPFEIEDDAPVLAINLEDIVILPA